MSKKVLIFLFSFLLFTASTQLTSAANPIPAPVPIDCPAGSENLNFNSLRPYQASPCGGSVEARMCSNDLVFTEGFELKGKGDCKTNGTTRTFGCDPKFSVKKHALFVDLSNTMLPILGNTEQVKNSNSTTQTLDDATLMNEYVSWYLNGVDNRAENGNSKNTNDSIINFSGPIQKIMPQSILEAQRIKTIESIGKTSTTTNETNNTVEEIANHNQIVVCTKAPPFVIIPLWITNILHMAPVGLGYQAPEDCYPTSNSKAQGTVYKLSSWNETNALQTITDTMLGYLNKLFPGNIVNPIINASKQAVTSAHWPHRFPPLPWDDGTGKPFADTIHYQKAYNEWRGQLCAILFGKLICIGAYPILYNTFADVFPYVPLANTVDKKGVELVTGVQIQPSGGTQLSTHGYGETKNAPLFFAHTEEVKNLSEFLNSSYTPKGFTSKPLPETTEKNVCSAVNVRTNQGDNLFPEATHGIEVHDVYYTISQVECTETFERICEIDKYTGKKVCRTSDILKCPAEVTITIKTDTKSPWLDNIFSTTVADSGSTFRKIFPKVGENAPVTCIADIPGVTNVSYNPDIGGKSQEPNGIKGSLSYETKNNPSDGGNASPQLTFPHLGSVYDYFLKGIQTALRPKGYGEPIESGTLCTTVTDSGVGSCKQWLFEKDSKGQYYYDKIIQAAGSTSCNGKSLNPVWALAIALNENGGLMSDKTKGESKSHFGCNINQIQSIEDKISCMTNTLRNDCVAGKTDEQTLSEYGYPSGYAMWPITVLAPGASYPPPLFGSSNINQIKTNLLNTNWVAVYGSKASTFCPNSPTLDSTRGGQW